MADAIDPYKIREYFKPLRVVDVADAMDGLGYFNIGLVSQEIRPLWLGMKFWGPAVTQRCVSNLHSFYGTSDIGFTFGEYEFGGTAWDQREHFMKYSPITCRTVNAGRVNTTAHTAARTAETPAAAASKRASVRGVSFFCMAGQ